MSSSLALEVNLDWVRLSPPPFPPQRHLLLLVGVPGRQGLEELQLVAVPHQPLRSDDTEALAPDLNHLQTTELVFLKNSPEQGITDVWSAVIRSKQILYRIENSQALLTNSP